MNQTERNTATHVVIWRAGGAIQFVCFAVPVMDAVCEECAPLVFDRYGDGREVQPQGVALCRLHAAAGNLLMWLEAHIEAFGECMCAHTPGTTCCDCRAREALRAAKGE